MGAHKNCHMVNMRFRYVRVCGGIHDANKMRNAFAKFVHIINIHNNLSQPLLNISSALSHSIVIKFNSFPIHLWMSIDILQQSSFLSIFGRKEIFL